MEFIYDGSHLWNELEAECLFKYTNGISVWIIFDTANKKQKTLIKLGEETLKEFNRVAEAEAFVQGMEMAAQKQGILFEKMEATSIPSTDEKLKEEFLKMKKQISELKKEKEKTQKLAEKLIKGIMKDKEKQTEQKIHEILLKHVAEL